MTRATYRLQLTPQLTFKKVERHLHYFAELGISHLYLSPIFEARSGSQHGYDVTNPLVIREELGGESDFLSLSESAKAKGLGILLDIVPNHMAASTENPFWWDTLALGQKSAYYKWFDFDSNQASEKRHGKILLPILGSTFKQALDENQFSIVFTNGWLSVKYFEHILPLSPNSVERLLRSFSTLTEESASFVKKLLATVKELGEKLRSRSKQPLSDIFAKCRHSLASIENTYLLEELLAVFNSKTNDASSAERVMLKAILVRYQAYELAFWKRTHFETSYRRFFDINELVGIRVENAEVFQKTHSKLLQLIKDKVIDAVRVDHIDGLRYPSEYLSNLQNAFQEVGSIGSAVYVEKILALDETLPNWPVAGTSGYDFLAKLDSTLLHREAFARIEKWYGNIFQPSLDMPFLLYRTKRTVLESTLSPDVTRLARNLKRFLQKRSSKSNMPTLGILKRALVETLSSIEVYRTYISRNSFSKWDKEVIDHALQAARDRGRASSDVLDILAEFFNGEPPEGDLEARFIARFQQVASATAAKGVEDTAFYQAVALSALNEVGNHPDHIPEKPIEAFHDFSSFIQHSYPNTMTTVSTHDTKRSADARGVLFTAAEHSKSWKSQMKSLERLSRDFCSSVGKRVYPDRNARYLFFQSALAIWDYSRNSKSIETRLVDYMIKASREAKIRTSWHAINANYENALQEFIKKCLADSAWVAELNAYKSGILQASAIKNLSRTIVHITAPGVPDIYQGDEVFNFRLVDPDNRKEPDFAALGDKLRRATKGVNALPNNTDFTDDSCKIAVLHTLLSLRKENPFFFQGASYQPVKLTGILQDYFLSFTRIHQDEALLVCTATMTNHLLKPSADRENLARTIASLPEALSHFSWRSIIGNDVRELEAEFCLEELLGSLPFCVLFGKRG